MDARFYPRSKDSFDLSVLLNSADIDTSLFSDSILSFQIKSLASLFEGGEGDLSFVENVKYQSLVESSSASFVLSSREFFDKNTHIANKLIPCDDPYVGIAKIAMFMYGYVNRPHFEISEYVKNGGSLVHSSAVLGENVMLGSGVVVGENVEIGSNVVIMSNSSIGRGCKIGDNTIIYENSNIKFSFIGQNCIIHPSCSIGQDGFGFAPCKKTKKLFKITHLGRVLIGDDVEIRAGVCIDRGSFSDTVISDGIKIDNLSQIGHNVKIGKSTVIAAQCGIAGSAEMGFGCMIGGQVGIAGHIKIGNLVQVAGKSGVIGDIDDGKKIGGYPAVDFGLWKRGTALLYSLCDMRKKKLKLSPLAKWIRSFLGV
jgi:UDP-3-O-[3-hydroxymyristoyl] glucosamine N-acyltransferase